MNLSRTHTVTPLILVAAALICVFFIFQQNVFSSYELLFYDFLFRLRPPLPINKDIVIVEISDDTLKNFGQWPLPRDFHASLIDVLNTCGARMIIFDIFFSEPTSFDTLLGESIQKAGNVYLPLVLDIPQSIDHSYALPETNRAIADNTLFKNSSDLSGHINTFIDPDGKIRRVPLFIRYKNSNIPQLSLLAACRFLGLDLNNISIEPRRITIDNKLSLPVSFRNSFFVNYPHLWQKSFKHFSYFEILKSYKDSLDGKSPSIDLAGLKDKVCFVGLTASGTSDIRPTPLESAYQMVGLEASVFNSIVQKKFIQEIPLTFLILIGVAVFLVALYICLKASPLRALLSIIGVAGFYFLVAAFLFISKGLWLRIFSVFFILFIVYVVVTLQRFLEEIRRRQILEKELEIAREIQKSFLPTDLNEFAGLKISSFMEPAKFVAGDLYDIIPLDEHTLGVFIADVSGKGVPASLIMARTISLLRVFAREFGEPHKVLMQLNRDLASFLEGKFVTAQYLCVDTKNFLMRASCAGHFPVLLYNANDAETREVLTGSGPPLGIMDSVQYETFSQEIKAGDRILLYTDGLSEARNRKGEEFGIERIKSVFSKFAQSKEGSIAQSLKQEVFAFSKGCPQHDDITVVSLQV